MSKKLVTNIGQLVTPRGDELVPGSEMSELSIFEDKEVLVEDGVIAEIGNKGSFDQLDIDNSDIVDAGDNPVLPGFVDPHTHFVFSGYRSEEFRMRLNGKSYEKIAEEGGGIASSVNSTREAPFSKLKEESKQRLRSMVRYGVTTVEGKTGYGLDKETELKQLKVMKELNAETPMEIALTFLGAHSIPPKYSNRRNEYVEFITREVSPIAARKGAEFCDVFCDEGAFTVEESRRILNEGRKVGLTPKIHADELAGTGGAELAAEVGAISADHLLRASDKGLQRMKEKGVVAVLLPITAFSLKENYARGRYMIDENLPVSLATDFNPGSCFSESIPLLISLATLYMSMTLEEAITGLTLNGAAAINKADTVGSVEPGKQADLVILEAPDYRHLSYNIGVNSVGKVLKKGKVIWEKNRPRF
ncbi:MAG: imidazolonepropionase [Candidatus Bipolaricaulia bacterium]